MKVAIRSNFVQVIAWFGGQLQINFMSKFLSSFLIAKEFRRGQLLRTLKSYEGN